MGHSIITRNARLKGDAGAVDPVLKHTVTSVTASSVDDLEQLVSIHSFDDRTKSLSKIICQVYKLNLAGVDEGESEKAEAGGSGSEFHSPGIIPLGRASLAIHPIRRKFWNGQKTNLAVKGGGASSTNVDRLDSTITV